MEDNQVPHNLSSNTNTSYVSSNISKGSCSHLDNPKDNEMKGFMDDINALVSCPLEGNILEGYDDDCNSSSLHDYFQVLCEVPLHAPPSSPLPQINHEPPLCYSFTKEPKFKEEEVVKRNSKGENYTKPIIKIKSSSSEEHQRDSLKEPKLKEVEVVKRNWKGKKVVEHGEHQHNYSSNRRNSEHKRRERINSKIKAIHALLPTCDKGDHASILDHAIKQIKSLQLQINMMSSSVGQSHLQYPYGPHRPIMQPFMVPQIDFGPYHFQTPSSDYPFMAPLGSGVGLPIQPRLQAQAQAQAQVVPFTPVLCPMQYHPTTITTPPRPTTVSFVPPLPEFTPPTTTSEESPFI